MGMISHHICRSQPQGEDYIRLLVVILEFTCNGQPFHGVSQPGRPGPSNPAWTTRVIFLSACLSASLSVIDLFLFPFFFFIIFFCLILNISNKPKSQVNSIMHTPCIFHPELNMVNILAFFFLCP